MAQSSTDCETERKSETNVTFLIIGGGIAGVSCAEQLSFQCPSENIVLITASPLIKAVSNIQKVTRMIEDFNVEEKPATYLECHCPNVRVIQDCVISLSSENRYVRTKYGRTLFYKKLCICCGGKPQLIDENNPYVVGIRDTETVGVLQEKLSKAKRILIVGNGGIATELAYEIRNCQVVWAVRHDSIGATFFDPGAAQFFLPHLREEPEHAPVSKRLKYTLTDEQKKEIKEAHGSALGPDWSQDLEIKGSNLVNKDVHVEYKSEVKSILTPKEYKDSNMIQKHFGTIVDDDWPVYVELTNGNVIGCDCVVSATGVVPNVDPFLRENSFELAEDKGIKVNEEMLTSVPDVYAAGDVCTTGWAPSELWFQMRLWTQARQMGDYAARCIAAHWTGEKIMLDACFDLFTHVTRFFGFKVVLLGLYNAQNLGIDYEVLLRVTKRKEYVKVILKDGKMKGAILIGETDLEETFENLLMNQLDLSPYGEDLLNPNIDIEDYFD